MNSFLQQTARAIIATIDWKELSRTTLVLPSHRAGLVLKDELLRLLKEQNGKAIWAPIITTLPQLQDMLSPLYAEDELFTIVRLYRHYCRLNAGEKDLMSLDMFYGWGRQMLADFTNIDASMPAGEVQAFFSNTISAHELSQWHLDPEVEKRLRALMNPAMESGRWVEESDSIRRQYELLWHQLYDLYIALHEEMKTSRKGYAGMRQRAVIEEWKSEELQAKISDRNVIFIGFNYLLPVERELMLLFSTTGRAQFYWDYVTDFKTNDKAFSFTQLNSNLLGNALPPCQWENPRNVTVVSCISREAQAQYVHQWLIDNYTEKGQRVGVVICDESMLEPVIYALPPIILPGQDQVEPINITKGFPLRNTQVFADVMRWLGDHARGDAEQKVTPELIDAMLNALFSAQSEENKENGISADTVAGLEWQELLILESEFQVRKIANQMRTLISKGIEGVPFTLKLLRLLMRRTMEAVTMPFHGEPVTDIQVMGVLETRMLDFDNLLLLNVEEGILPQRQADSSFIPFYLRKTYHMQTADERATVYAYNFFRLLSRAAHTTLLFASAETAEGGKGMSRFLMQMLVSPEFNVTKMQLTEESMAQMVNSFTEGEKESLISKLHVQNDIIYRPDGKPYCLSPSALNTYISCPFSFYLQYVLGKRPLEQEDTLFASNTLGSFVHHAMQYIYESFLGCDSKEPKTVSPDEIKEIYQDNGKLEEALKKAYEQMNSQWRKDHKEESQDAPPHYRIDEHVGENEIILGYIRNILARDSKDAGIGLKIVLLEQRRTFPIKLDIGSLETGGTIDRLDIYGPEGAQVMRVVDYKSGSYSEKKMSATSGELMSEGDKNYVRQTLIYSCAAELDKPRNMRIEPHLFFCRHNLIELDTSIYLDNKQVSDISEIKDDFVSSLSNTVEELLTTTHFPQCAEDKCPPFCPFFLLCGRKPKDF